MNIADLDFLTPGSVFTRQDGRESRFLFLTNQSLPKKIQDDYPPQVVYADENGNILSCDIDRFLNKRKFLNVDPELESRLNNVLALGSAGGEDTLDLDGDELTIDDGTGSSVFDALDGEEEPDGDTAEPVVDLNDGSNDIDDAQDIVKYLPVNAVADVPSFLTAEQLGLATASYQQGPGVQPGTIQHSLFIRDEPGITSKTLHASFSLKNAETNTIYDFQVEIEGREIVVNWDTFVGIFPCVFFGSRMYQVVFSSDANYAVPAATPAAPTPQQAVETQVAAQELSHAEADAELAAIEAEVAATPVPAAIQVTIG
jgi:hypothetical protein